MNKELETRHMNGIIFTDLTALSDKFGCFSTDLEDTLLRFIRGKENGGVHYRLVDVSNYAYADGSKTVHLSSKDGVDAYREVLMDIHRDEMERCQPISEYLFIIGSNDIVPVGCVDHYVSDLCDKHIDTDIPYAYPQFSDIGAKLESGDLFLQEQIFFVGRLPIGEDQLDSEVAEIEDIVIYLQQSMNLSGGVPMQKAYAQVDARWRKSSEAVLGRLKEEGFLTGNLLLSPEVDAGNLDDVFDPAASLYYYNLRGCDEAEKSGYYAFSEEGVEVEAIDVFHHMACIKPNVIISEASYGARFMDKEKSTSMLLAAIYAKTMAFFGASRISWGGDSVPACADVFAQSLIDALLDGYTFGQALFVARARLMKSGNASWNHTLSTLIQFNLYGDPTLFMTGRNSAFTGKHLEVKTMEPPAVYSAEIELSDKTVK